VKTKLNPTLAGMFVLCAFGLLAAALLSFRSCHLLSKPARFTAHFDESVQGLDVGGPVKLRGVRVGRVQAIRLMYDPKARQSQVVVVGELDENVMRDHAGQPVKLTDRATLERLIQAGLRAKIDLAGITGLQFVELDFLDPQQFPAPPTEKDADYPEIPTVTSDMSELVANVSKVMRKLNEVDYAGLSRELQTLLATANQQLADLGLKAMVAKVTAAAQSIEALAGSAEAKAAFAHLNETATDVQGLVAKLDAQVEPVRTEMVRTLRSFHDAAESVRELLGPQSGLGEEAVRALRQVTETAEALQQLAEYLERNPNALITGRSPPTKHP